MNSRSCIRHWIFAHLVATGALLPGCGDGTPPPTTATTTADTTTEVPGPVPAEPTSPAATATTSAPGPEGTGEPAPSASVTAAGSKPLGAQCNDNGECESGHCRLGFTGAEFIKPGQCVKDPPVYKGRPLTVDGASHVAALEARGGLGEVVAPQAIAPLGAPIALGELGAHDGADVGALEPALRQRLAELFATWAVEEHASIAAFARTVCELMALGAPAWLLADTQRALGDEIAHADACLRWCEALGGEPVVPGALPAAVAPFAAQALARELLAEVLRGGCVGETRAAHEALVLAHEAPLPAMRAHFRRIAEDEARHAALAFRTARWLLDTQPEHRSHAQAVIEEQLTALCAADRDMLEPLLSPLLA